MILNLTKRSIISIGIILFALVIGFSTSTGFSLGDKLFRMVGLSPWSGGQTGLHYTIFIVFTTFMIGILEVKREITGRRLLLLIVILILLTPSIASITESLYYKTQKGLAAVKYDNVNSHFNISNTDDNMSLIITGCIVLTNYGSNPIEASIKIPHDPSEMNGWFQHDIVLTETADGQKVINLNPGEKTDITIYTIVPIPNDLYHATGSMNGPNLLLYNDAEQRIVGNNL